MMQNPFLAFLEEEPQAAYFSYGNQFGGPNQSRQQRQHYQQGFADIYHQYLGQLGQQARANQMPTGTFNDFLGGYNFDQAYREDTPYGQRAPGGSPYVRWDQRR